MQPDQPAQGSTADNCSRWPGEPHAISTHLRDGIAVRRCGLCGWIDFADLRAQQQAAYQRGLAAGQAERDQLRRLHEATEAALEHAEQYARDLQDDGVLTEEAREQGIAEGRRQATEGLAREWGVELSDEDEGRVWPADDEADAREYVVRVPSHRVVSRLVGPWETAEQPESGGA